MRLFSITELDKFWASVWDFTKVVSSTGFNQVVDLSVRMDAIPKWFTGARLNYAENSLRRNDDGIAIYSAG